MANGATMETKSMSLSIRRPKAEDCSQARRIRSRQPGLALSATSHPQDYRHCGVKTALQSCSWMSFQRKNQRQNVSVIPPPA